MNKEKLVGVIVEKTTITKKQASEIVGVITEAIVEAVAAGEKVTLVGFGTFEARQRAEREGRNPKTGVKIAIPAALVPSFSAGKVFKDRVKENGAS